MSMIGNYRRVSESELSRVCADPKSISDFLYAESNDDTESRRLDIDKSWHAIHFLLNDSPWEGAYPLVCIVLGGECIGEEDVGYGPARYLTVQQVKDVANAIDQFPAWELLQKYDANRMNDEEIYPHGWRDLSEERDYISQNYLALVKFFKDAAAANDAMIVYLN